jgi:peptidyl-prolyl cis-trans isomerase A (cyclophilin A)
MRTALLTLALLAAAPRAPTEGAVAHAASTTALVRLETGLGDVLVEVDLAHAPRTSANFLRYVEAGRYDGGRFHRTVTFGNQPGRAVKIAVVQAGVPEEREGEDFPPIPLERTCDTGLTHLDGAVSMARDGPDSATSDFFICVGAQPALDFGGRRNPDGQGFAVFGRVVDGMEVVRRIWGAPARDQTLEPPIPIRRATRLREGEAPRRSGAGPASVAPRGPDRAAGERP